MNLPIRVSHSLTQANSQLRKENSSRMASSTEDEKIRKPSKSRKKKKRDQTCMTTEKKNEAECYAVPPDLHHKKKEGESRLPAFHMHFAALLAAQLATRIAGIFCTAINSQHLFL